LAFFGNAFADSLVLSQVSIFSNQVGDRLRQFANLFGSVPLSPQTKRIRALKFK
jgi:hypothetical protein